MCGNETTDSEQPMSERRKQKRSKKYLETNENENTTYTNTTPKAMLKENFMVMKAYIMKKEWSQINNLTLHLKELEKTDTADIQGIIKEYYEQLYANILDNLEEMDKFLETYTLPRLNPEEIQSLNTPTMSNIE